MRTNYSGNNYSRNNYSDDLITPKPIEKNPIEKHGAYIGLVLSAIWLIIAIWGFIYIRKGKEISKFFYILPIFLLLLAISNISYFYIEKNNLDVNYVNNNIFHISMIPIYIILIIICIAGMSHH
jgi:hypothetical protein